MPCFISICILFLIMLFDLNVMTSFLLFSCRDLLMAVDFGPPLPIRFASLIRVEEVMRTRCENVMMISMNPHVTLPLRYFSLCWAPRWNAKQEKWKIRTGYSVSRNSHRRWWHCVLNTGVFWRRGRRGTVDCKIKKHTAKNKGASPPANEIQRINKYNCFLSDGNTSKFIQRTNILNGFQNIFLCPFCWYIFGITQICFNGIEVEAQWGVAGGDRERRNIFLISKNPCTRSNLTRSTFVFVPPIQYDSTQSTILRSF